MFLILLVFHLTEEAESGLEVIFFFMLKPIEQGIIMFIHAKMSTIIGILTFIRMIDTPSESLKA